MADSGGGAITIVACVKALKSVLMHPDDSEHPPLLPVAVVIQLIGEYAIEFVGTCNPLTSFSVVCPVWCCIHCVLCVCACLHVASDCIDRDR